MGEPATLFLVEDDIDVREAISDTLAEAGYRVVTAGDGLEALALLRRADTAPRLILLDLSMPRMDGEEFRKEQLADPSIASIPVVVLTARPSPPDLGAVATLKKPIARDPLIRLVDRVCGEPR